MWQFLLKLLGCWAHQLKKLCFVKVFVKQNAERSYTRYPNCTVCRDLVKIWTTEIVSKSIKLYSSGTTAAALLIIYYIIIIFINDIKPKRPSFIPVRQVYHILVYPITLKLAATESIVIHQYAICTCLLFQPTPFTPHWCDSVPGLFPGPRRALSPGEVTACPWVLPAPGVPPQTRCHTLRPPFRTAPSASQQTARILFL